MTNLKPHEVQALEYLAKGPDTIGIIDTEEKMAAALVFGQLRQQGLTIADIGENGPTYRITPAGLSALAQQ